MDPHSKTHIFVRFNLHCKSSTNNLGPCERYEFWCMYISLHSSQMGLLHNSQHANLSRQTERLSKQTERQIEQSYSRIWWRLDCFSMAYKHINAAFGDVGLKKVLFRTWQCFLNTESQEGEMAERLLFTIYATEVKSASRRTHNWILFYVF